MRKTTPKDIEQILRFLYAYYHENQKIMPMDVDFDLEECWTFLKKALAHPNIISYISDNGVIMGELSQPWFGKTPVARGIAWYVKPENRNGILARSLMRAYDNEARERGARYSKQEFDNAAHLEVIDSFMKLMDYKDYSKIYLKDLHGD